MRLRREYQQNNVLIAHHNVAAGRVLLLSFDRTWRLRYRVGDTYHHKFWGQILRWATSAKLPGGTTLLKIGSDRSHYACGEPVRIRVKLLKADYSPLADDEAAVEVFTAGGGDARPVLRKKLQASQTPGSYFADLGVLGSGAYRVRLDSPAAKKLLPAEKFDKVEISFSVDSTAPAEQIELASRRSLLSHLAEMTGGAVVDPWQAHQVVDLLGPAVLKRTNKLEYSLWDSWFLLGLMIVTATCEWLLRKKVGLA